MRHDGTYLIPSSQDSVENYEKLKEGQEYKVEVRKARNPGHHRKAFSLINRIFHNQDVYTNETDLLVELKLQCGWYDEHITTKGKVIYLPKSMDFSSMDQTEFEGFYTKLVTVAFERWGIEEALTYE